MRDRLQHLEACAGSCALSSLARPEPNSPSSCTIITVLAGLPAASLIAARLSSAVLRDDAEAGPEAEGVLQPARDDLVGHADVDHVGQVVARGRLRGGEADRAGEAADDGRDAGLHLLDLGGAALGRRSRIAEHGLDLARGP